jgi:hypothetical protein
MQLFPDKVPPEGQVVDAGVLTVQVLPDKVPPEGQDSVTEAG